MLFDAFSNVGWIKVGSEVIWVKVHIHDAVDFSSEFGLRWAIEQNVDFLLKFSLFISH